VTSPSRDLLSPSRNRSPPSEEGNLLDNAASELILGKFKNQDDLINSYQNLEKMLSGKFDDDMVRNMAMERGLIQTAPETYADLDKQAEELGLNYGVENGLAAYQEWGKSHNLSQDAMQAGLQLYHQEMQNMYAFMKQTHGIDDRNMQEKSQALKDLWGKDYERNRTAATQWGKANLDPVVLNALAMHPEGMDFVNSLRLKSADASPITDSDVPAQRVGDLQGNISELMRGEAYNNPRHPAHAEVHSRIDKLMEMKLRRAGAI